jgi:hypothetical protein
MATSRAAAVSRYPFQRPLTNNHKDISMTDQPSTASTSAPATNPMQDKAQAKKLLRADIGSKWGKFSEQELTDLKDNDDLVTQLVAKYGLERDAAQRDAAAVVKGRTF